MAHRKRAVLQTAAIGGAALVALLVPGGAAVAAPTADTSYSFKSQAGDYVGAGRTASYQVPPATIGVSGTAGFLTVSVLCLVASILWFIGMKHLERDTALAPTRLAP